MEAAAIMPLAPAFQLGHVDALLADEVLLVEGALLAVELEEVIEAAR
ncbi:hypothetical protein [Sorangium sp. So ce394]